MHTIERARPDDRPALEALLRSNDLPLDGLDGAMGLAVLAREGDAVLGCAAVEPYGRFGLLRSVCVVEELRGTGLGHALVAAAETLAAEAGIDDLFLLTETAVEWFPRLGYVATTRDAAPADMAASPEFASACPVSAAVLHKRLAVPAGS